MAIETIQWVNGHVKLIDQRKLPLNLKYIHCRDVKTLWQAIRNLSVRGAPALGVAAAFGLLLGVKNSKGKDRKKFEKKLKEVSCYLATSRPTAVNLFNALSRMEDVLALHPNASVETLKKLLQKEAKALFREDQDVCRKMGDYGANLIRKHARILTVCNAGALATVDYGTALGVFYSAKAKKKKFQVFACETRPLLQGARLTTWELLKEKIDTTLICDNMAATLMQQKKIDMIFTGADRIALNGDTANKIGTYSLAVLARHHKIPFYVVAPRSTFDHTAKTGQDIPIEQRSCEEVTHMAHQRIAPKGIKVYNPAFDVTDHKLITAIVTESGVLRPPFRRKIKKLLSM